MGEYHPRIRAAHAQAVRRLGRGRAGSLKRFATRVAPRRRALQPYLHQSHVVLLVRLNHPASRVATRVRVNVKDANAYEALCRELGVDEILLGVHGRHSLDRLPAREWADQPVLRAVRLGDIDRHDVRPGAVPHSLHPHRAGQLRQAYDRLAEQVGTQLGTAVAALASTRALRQFVEDRDALGALVRRAVPPVSTENAAQIAAEIARGLHAQRRPLRRLKKLRERQAARATQQAHAAGGPDGQDDWSDDEEDLELVQARTQYRAQRAALEAARTRPLTDAEQDELAHEGAFVAQLVAVHLRSPACATLRARLVAEAEREKAPIACGSCGGAKKPSSTPAEARESESESEEENEDGADEEEGYERVLMRQGGLVEEEEEEGYERVLMRQRGLEEERDARMDRYTNFNDYDEDYGYEEDGLMRTQAPIASSAAAAPVPGLEEVAVTPVTTIPPIPDLEEVAVTRTATIPPMPVLEEVGALYPGSRSDDDDDTSTGERLDVGSRIMSQAVPGLEPLDVVDDAMPVAELVNVGSCIVATQAAPGLEPLLVADDAETSDPSLPGLEFVGAPVVTAPRPALAPIAASVQPVAVEEDEEEEEEDDDLPTLVESKVSTVAAIPKPVQCRSLQTLSEHLVEHKAHHDLYQALRDTDGGVALKGAQAVYLKPLEEFGTYTLRQLTGHGVSTADQARAAAELLHAPAPVTEYTPAVRYDGGAHPVTFYLCPAQARDE